MPPHVAALLSQLLLLLAAGTFALHSRCLRNKFLLLVILAVLLLCCTSATAAIQKKTTATAAAAVAASSTLLTLHDNASAARECGSIDVRNECLNLLQLQGCTVIKGYLIIVLLPKVNVNADVTSNNASSNAYETCDYTQYRFPLLREITDYLIFFNVKGLRSIREMFPNLTVIRGRRLFLNYALGITNMPDLEALEFKSLVAIQRGHVFIGSCPKLCNLEKINWDRLTLSVGENHIYPVAPETCPNKSICKGCPSDYCWSNAVCQLSENDNVINLVKGIQDCHQECLGGCHSNYSSPNTCVVCRRLTDHGSCVKECPGDKYLQSAYQRCYTKEECNENLGLYTYQSQCLASCPNDFIGDSASEEELGCMPCQPLEANAAITIFNLADIDRIRGCEVLNGSLVISIRNKISESDLYIGMSKLREIRGHLKIYRSPHLTSLKFLEPLRKIVGEPLENGIYGLVIYDNKNLRELWNVKNFELERGSMYVHLNNKLCNRKLKEFSKKVVHDKKSDTLQINDQEVLCEPTKLMLHVEVLSHHAVMLSWRKEQTSDEIEVLYRSIPPGEIFVEHSEMDSNICTRIKWQRLLLFQNELTDNSTHFSYTIRDLAPYTRYACLVKTFGTNDIKDARSELIYVTTRLDLPTPPAIVVTKKTDVSLTLQLTPQNRSLEMVNYYVLELYELPDDQTLLDRRDYCIEPAYPSQESSSNHNEDYVACCARMEEQAEDAHFQQQMRDAFGCRLDQKQNCGNNNNSITYDAKENLTEAQKMILGKPIRNLRLQEANASTYTLHHLTRYRLYLVQVQACNVIGCGSFSMHWERTNYSIAGDWLENLSACRVPNTHEYHVLFNEPQHPNGLIVSYVIHYRVYVPDADTYRSHIECVTRLQHAKANYHHITVLDAMFNEVAVRVHSLAGDILNHWVNVSLCPYEPVTKLAGIGVGSRHVRGLNIFLICFLLGALGTLVWVCYKRRYWRLVGEWRRCVPPLRNWCTSLTLRSDAAADDRQILVDEFETVRFHNDSDDERGRLE